MSTILVTGAGGFVGRSLVQALLNQGHRVIGLARSGQQVDAFRANPLFMARIMDLATQEATEFPDWKIDVLVHLASRQPSSPQIGYEEYYRGNVTTAATAAAIAKKASVRLVVLTSSTTVHGTGSHGVINGETAVDPGNFYALTKYIAEKILALELAPAGINLAVLRCPSLMGPGQGGGFIDTYYQLARQGKDMDIYSRGTRRRNALHVYDLTGFIAGLVNRSQDLSGVRVFAAGSANALPMGEIAQIIRHRSASRSKINFVDRPLPIDTDIEIDSSALVKASGWHPMTMEEALTRFVEEMKQ